MSRLSKPDAMTTGMMQFDEMTKAYRAAMPQEFASAVNLMAHPVASAAAAGALGLGLASHAMGIWMGSIAGMAEATRRLLDDAGEMRREPAKPPVALKVVASAPEKAAAAARTVAAEAETMARAAVEAAVEAVEAPIGSPVEAESAARAEPVADDLKAISGIGPKLEKVLNGLGIFTYAQVAALTEAEIAKLDDQLGFAGRIERDDWIGQAKKLAGR